MINLNAILNSKILSNGSEDMVQSGKRAFLRGFVSLKTLKSPLNKTILMVKDDRYNNLYKVTVDLWQNQHDFKATCTCSYNLTPICRHKIAAFLFLQQLVDNGELTIEVKENNTLSTQVNLESFKLLHLKKFISTQNYEKANELQNKNTIKNLVILKDEVHADVVIDKKIYPIVIKRSSAKLYDTSCPCQTEKNLPSLFT